VTRSRMVLRTQAATLRVAARIQVPEFTVKPEPGGHWARGRLWSAAPPRPAPPLLGPGAPSESPSPRALRLFAPAAHMRLPGDGGCGGVRRAQGGGGGNAALPTRDRAPPAARVMSESKANSAQAVPTSSTRVPGQRARLEWALCHHSGTVGDRQLAASSQLEVIIIIILSSHQ
jgi:hypothetical protein